MRRFLHDDVATVPSSHPPSEQFSELVSAVRAAVVGEGQTFQGPFGPRPMTYTDFGASGKPLAFIEDQIRNDVMPFYGNTHTSSSECGF